MSAWRQYHWYTWKSKEKELLIENVQKNIYSGFGCVFFFFQMPTQLINETSQ